MMNFAVVVVTYNRLELLKECLECIRNQELVPNNVVIVDNNSTDGTGKYLNGIKEIIEHVCTATKEGHSKRCLCNNHLFTLLTLTI